MTKTERQAVNARIRGLCDDRKIWESGHGPHFDHSVTCDHRMPQPPCEGCGMKLYRADRIAEISAEMKALRDTLPDTPKQAKRKAKPAVEQLPLFA